MSWEHRISFSNKSGPCYGQIHTDGASHIKTQAARSSEDCPERVKFLAELAERRFDLSTR